MNKSLEKPKKFLLIEEMEIKTIRFLLHIYLLQLDVFDGLMIIFLCGHSQKKRFPCQPQSNPYIYKKPE